MISDDELGFTVIDVDPDLESEEFAGISAGTDPRTYKTSHEQPRYVTLEEGHVGGNQCTIAKWNLGDCETCLKAKKAIGSGWGVQDQTECRWLN